ncbi:MAG: hypothetical protein V1872_02815 [bacterium]
MQLFGLQRLEEDKIEVIDLLESFRETKRPYKNYISVRFDQHWSDKGHDVVAREILTDIRKRIARE